MNLWFMEEYGRQIVGTKLYINGWGGLHPGHDGRGWQSEENGLIVSSKEDQNGFEKKWNFRVSNNIFQEYKI